MFPYAGIQNSRTSISAFDLSYNCTTNVFTLRRHSILVKNETFEEHGTILEVVIDYNCTYENGETVRNHCMI